MKPSILIAEDDRKLSRILELLLEGEGYRLTRVSDGESAISSLEGGSFDVLLTDLQMPKADGLAVLARARELDPDLPVLVITAYGTIGSAVEAMRRGAFDYLQKPFDDSALKLQISRALETRRLRLQNRALRSTLAEASGFHRILGSSASLRAAIDLAEKVSATDSTVLLLGESGTGKELFARAIHERGSRAAGPFIHVNCAAIPATLIESELFGVERGAFTGADRAMAGKFERAHRGTLFLDEIGELELAIQPKLLRGIEERTIERLGGGSPRAVDIRLIAATNRDLEAAVGEGSFRGDLFHRLQVFPITLPSLRQRKGDIPELVQALIARFNEAMGRTVTGASAEALRKLESHAWPGNVRQLANTVERAMILCSGSLLDVEHLAIPGERTETTPNGRFALPDEGISLDDLEGSLLRQALERTGGNKARAAKLLGLTRNTLRYRLEKHGLE